AAAATFQTGKDGSGLDGAAGLRLTILDHDARCTGSQGRVCRVADSCRCACRAHWASKKTCVCGVLRVKKPPSGSLSRRTLKLQRYFPRWEAHKGRPYEVRPPPGFRVAHPG